MGALNNPGGYFLLALVAIALALQALVALSDWAREPERPAEPVRSGADTKKGPWECGHTRQEPERDVA